MLCVVFKTCLRLAFVRLTNVDSARDDVASLACLITSLVWWILSLIEGHSISETHLCLGFDFMNLLMALSTGQDIC